MGASEIQEFWKREILTAGEFVQLWLKEVPGDDPYVVIEMLAHLAANDYRCVPIPWYHPVFELFNPEQTKKREEAQNRAVTTLRSIAKDRAGLERADAVQLMRDGLLQAFEARKAGAPRFLYPPTLSSKLRDARESGALDVAIRAAKAAALDCEHSPDFRSVRWYGTLYTFSLKQARAVEVLWHAWEAGELGVSQKDIGEAVESASDNFRLRDLFRLSQDSRGMHPAWKTMIHDTGRGVYALRRPSASAATPR